ncbi:RNA dependent RNA polymerase-domain-containing protein [Stachybotrys elegans]|uniref:RNA-dependent RNA polymerase n=1 Tax=Stachybotrys elegans TaxID=80388 RepID=A0A8K0T2Y3_9HYPO|nr:RNA dependent RNA polymerase-domain-containing protein [Stachybotrys elegans]
MPLSHPDGATRTADGFRACIRSLNSEYGLDIRLPDPTLSPRKHKATLRSPEEHQANDAYKRIQVLYYNDNDLLNHSLNTFYHVAADFTQHPTVPGAYPDPLGARHLPATERAALLKLLLQCLPDSQDILQKRVSPPVPYVTVKKAKCLFPASTGNDGVSSSFSSVDDIPVRSSLGGLGVTHPPPLDDADWDMVAPRSSVSMRNNTSFATVSSLPTRQSFTSGYSSSVVNDDTPMTTQSSPPDDEEQLEAASKSFSGLASDYPVSDYPGLPNLHCGEEKFLHIWPKPPPPSGHPIPLAILFEVTRLANHCNVDLSKVDIGFRPDAAWSDQMKLREKLKDLPAFHDKKLPPTNDPAAWKAALNNFQVGEKAVTLSVDLKYRTDVRGPLFDVVINPLKKPELSHRLGRRFGADRFLEVNLERPDSRPKALSGRNGHDKVVSWLTQERHHFLGRVWNAFFMRTVDKPEKRFQVYFFATDGDSFTNPTAPGPPPPTEALDLENRTKLGLDGLLTWALNLPANVSEQPPLKLFCRLALSVGRTVPTITLELRQIRHRKDITSPKIMNDGIGRISRSLTAKIAKRLGSDEIPAAFQARFGSAKGMWMVDVEDDGLVEDDWIEIYESQKKWKCDYTDVHHRTFEVKSWPGRPSPASANQQLIPILEEQSLDKKAMRETLAKHLLAHIQERLVMEESALNDPRVCRLWLQQDLIGTKHQAADFISFTGGLPDRDAHIVSFLLDSGFSPTKLSFLKDIIEKIKKDRINALDTKINFTIPQSTSLLMLADFSGTLEEGEIYVAFSTDFEVEDYTDSRLDDIDVLVARMPAHYPSDIQKARAVSPKALRKLRNVVVFSMKGERPLADLLSGGDYDGDRAWICWDPDIVSNFVSVDVPKTPDLLEAGYLRKSPLKAHDLQSTDGNVEYFCRRFIYESFRFTMNESILGVCTSFKEKYCYHFGIRISDPKIVILSRLLGDLVDQVKQGIIFEWADWKRFQKEVLGYDPPPSKSLPEPHYNITKAKESSYRRLGRYDSILDFLRFNVAVPATKEAMIKSDRALQGIRPVKYDEDLTYLYNYFEAQEKDFESFKTVRVKLREDLETHYGQWRDTVNQNLFTERVMMTHRAWVDIAPDPKVVASCPALRIFLGIWGDDHHNSSMWMLLKASTTFHKFYNGNEKFAWRMAGRQLALLKGLRLSRKLSAGGPSAAVLVTPDMWAALRPNKKFIKSRMALQDDDEFNSAAALHDVAQYDEDGGEVDDA